MIKITPATGRVLAIVANIKRATGNGLHHLETVELSVLREAQVIAQQRGWSLLVGTLESAVEANQGQGQG